MIKKVPEFINAIEFSSENTREYIEYALNSNFDLTEAFSSFYDEINMAMEEIENFLEPENYDNYQEMEESIIDYFIFTEAYEQFGELFGKPIKEKYMQEYFWEDWWESKESVLLDKIYSNYDDLINLYDIDHNIAYYFNENNEKIKTEDGAFEILGKLETNTEAQIQKFLDMDVKGELRKKKTFDKTYNITKLWKIKIYLKNSQISIHFQKL